MFTVRFENAGKLEQATASETIATVSAVISYAAKSTFGRRQRGQWFKDQANSQGLLDKLKAMDRYVNKQCTVLSFVVKTVGVQVDSAPVEATDMAQVMRAPLLSSGTRIYILPNFCAQTHQERVNTVCHELSHRVIQTTDRPNGVAVYGRGPALALAGVHAVNCAEVFGYFYMDLAIEMGLIK
jgi:hypothetical protein